MLLVIGANEVMIPMRPHSGGNKKRSPNSQCDRPVIEGNRAIALFTVGIASPFVNIAPNKYNKVKIWNFFLFTSLVKTVLKLLT